MPDSESLKGKTRTQFCYFVINIASAYTFFNWHCFAYSE